MKNLILLLLAIVLLSSCATRRKKKCNTCPTWNSIEKVTPEQKQNVRV